MPWEDIIWRPSKPELMDYDYKDGVRVEPLPDGMDLDLALEAGEVDAIFVPHPPKSVLSGNGRMRRLFPDCRAEEARYYRARGAFPIMHLVVIRRDLIEREPWLGHAVIDMFADAKRISDGYLDDPNWSRLAWERHNVEAERAALGDPWPIGFAANRDNIARFIMYAADQNLISGEMAPEALFADAALDT